MSCHACGALPPESTPADRAAELERWIEEELDRMEASHAPFEEWRYQTRAIEVAAEIFDALARGELDEPYERVYRRGRSASVSVQRRP